MAEVATDDPILRPLIASHMAHSEASSPATSRHNLDQDAVMSEMGLRMWVAFDGDVALGCAAMKPLDASEAEVKSVHVLPAARGRGAARAMMDALIEVAIASRITALYLETGPKTLPAYDAARALYERLGFAYCGPFAHYRPDPYSAFMFRSL